MARVLVIDDSELNREMLARRLSRKGHTVVEAADAETGLAAAAADPPDVVLMDMSLPGMDGLEATRRLKAEPLTAKVPVVLLTAHAIEGARDAATDAGCDAYETKPVDLPRLLAVIARLTPHLPNPAPPPPPPAELPVAVSIEMDVFPSVQLLHSILPSVRGFSPVGDVLADLRHNLRTALGHILMFVGEVLDPSVGLPDDFSQPVGELRGLGESLLEVIDRMRPPADPSETELAGVVERACSEILPSADRAVELASQLAERATAVGLASAAADLRTITAAAEAIRRMLANVKFSEPVLPPTPPPPPPPPPPGGAKVLVVDDDSDNRQLFTRWLQRQGHTFVEAVDGQSALDRLREQDFDVVLLDLLMPGLSGHDVLRELKADPDRRHIPVVVISASDELAGVVQCLEAGAEDYLPKPCDPVLLRARLAGCLEKKRLRDRELEYLRQVQAVTAAAEAVEGGNYDLATLASVSEREDALGTLARVFGRMAGEVKNREDRLKQEVLELKVVIDERRRAAQVAEVTETDYFRELRVRVNVMRERRDQVNPDANGGN